MPTALPASPPPRAVELAPAPASRSDAPAAAPLPEDAGPAAPPSSGAAVQPDPVGTWEGTLSTGGATLRVVVHIQRGQDGALTATMDSPDQGATGIPVGSVTVDGDSLHLDVPAVGGSYDGAFAPDGDTVEGTWRQSGLSLPLTLERRPQRAGEEETGDRRPHDEQADEGHADEGPGRRAGDDARKVDGDDGDAEREAGGTAEREEPPRPQEPEPPYPYRSEEVTFRSASDGIRLAGTLTLPGQHARQEAGTGAGPFPAVALVTGSGAQDRDETVAGHRPFLILADRLTRRGIAVLRWDDRGVGGSGGSLAGATSRDLAQDALGAVRFLRGRPDVDPAATGLLGHSEGGVVSAIAAATSGDVRFLVLLATPGLPGSQIAELQVKALAEAAGIGDRAVAARLDLQRALMRAATGTSDSAEAARRIREVVDSALVTLPREQRRAQADRIVRETLSPWSRFYLAFDPASVLESVGEPVLALWGEKDLQVPPDPNRRALRRALEAAGHEDVTLRTLPGLNHLFQNADTGLPSEYAEIEETMDPRVPRLVADWILERFGG